MSRQLDLTLETWPLQAPFRITGKTITKVDLLVARIEQDGRTGFGEAAGIFYCGETGESILAQASAVTADIEDGAGREDLLAMLPRGGARNALDCALWDLEAKHSGQSCWQALALKPNPLTTVMTIGIDTPGKMAKRASQYSAYPVLKIKLDSHEPLERLSAVRAARPDATLVVDANQGFDAPLLSNLIAPFADLGLAMLEQPLPRGEDAALADIECPFPLCADESCLDLSELEEAAKLYQMINIKLDKTGGLTHALQLMEAAQEKGLALMVGNMHGTSLAMAPAYIIGQFCRYADIDGPLLLAQDRDTALSYNGAQVAWPTGQPFWGEPC